MCLDFGEVDHVTLYYIVAVAVAAVVIDFVLDIRQLGLLGLIFARFDCFKIIFMTF